MSDVTTTSGDRPAIGSEGALAVLDVRVPAGFDAAGSEARWAGPSVLRIEASRVTAVVPADDFRGDVDTSITGTVLPGFCDAHVHLGLVDAAALVAGGISRVVDLGWDPRVAAGWTRDLASSARPETAIAGAMLTAPGGYPLLSGWAPAESVRTVDSAADARRAVQEMASSGAALIKVMLNSDVGPVWDDDLLALVVAAAHDAALPVAAHTQGLGQAARAFAGGVDLLAHTPWTERLTDDAIRTMAGRMGWISTLDIHGWGNSGTDHAIASSNLERFVAFGGRVHYGTDLGNGPLPIGLNPRELNGLVGIGLAGDRLLDALGHPVAPGSFGRRVNVVSGRPPGDSTATVDWLLRSESVDLAALLAASVTAEGQDRTHS